MAADPPEAVTTLRQGLGSKPSLVLPLCGPTLVAEHDWLLKWAIVEKSMVASENVISFLILQLPFQIFTRS
jgi:hypothetical protein